MIHALLDGLAAAEHHRRRRTHSELVRSAMDVDPLLGAALQTRDAMTHCIIENLRAAAGDGIETRVAQSRDRIAQAQSADFSDIRHLRRRKAVQVNLKALLDAAEEVLVPLDLQVGMQAALH